MRMDASTSGRKWFLPAALIALILVCGGIDARFGQMSYMSDGVSYLDISQAIHAHQWKVAVSTFWGMGYPIALALFRPLFAAGPVGEWNSVYFTNYMIFCATLLSYFYLVTQLRKYLVEQAGKAWETIHWVLALAIFLGMQLSWDRVSRDTPDLFVSCIAFLATALLLDIAGRPAFLKAVLLGLVCGFGYLVKAIYLPFSLITIFIALPLLVTRRRIPLAALAAIGFAALAVPYVAAMSWALGVFTTGEAGPLNVAWMVNGLHYWTNWQGGPAAFGQPLHPTHLALAAPRVYTYADTFPVTYPPFFNPPYFYLGFRHFFSIKNQIHATLATVFHLVQLLVIHPFIYAVAAAVVMLFLWLRGAEKRAETSSRILLAALPAFVAICLYMLININGRYISGFLSVVLLFGLMITLTDARIAQKRVVAVVAVLLAAAWVDVAIVQRTSFREMAHDEKMRDDTQWKVASALAASGVHPGDKVAVIVSFDPALCTWAHFLGAHIVGETQSKDYWAAPAQTQQQVLDIYRQTGVELVLADKDAGVNTPDGWTAVPDTSFVFRKLSN